MSDKDFKVKNKLVINGLTQVGPLVADSNKQVDATPYLTPLQGGTGTTTAPSSGQILYSSSGTTYAPTALNTLDVKGASYSDNAPSSPVVGQIWVESDTSSDSFDPNIMRRKTFTATANQTVFTTDLEFIQGYEQVFFNGMLLIRNSDYTTASNTNVTLAAGAAAGDIIEVVSITNLNSINAATTTSNTFTGNQRVDARIGIGGDPTNNSKLDIFGVGSRIRWELLGSTPTEISTNLAANAYADKASDAANHSFKTNGSEKFIITPAAVLSNVRLTAYGSVGDGDYIIRAHPLGGASGQRSNVAFYATFSNFPQDTGPRRVADIIGGFSTGTWGTEYLSFNVGSSGDGQNVASEKMRIDNSGNVSIGGTPPTNTRLHLYNSDVSNPVQLVLHNANAGGSRYLILGSGGANAASFEWDNNNGNAAINTLTSARLLFRTNNTTGMMLDTSQYLLVGYTSSNGSYRLQVNSQIFATSSSIATSDGRYKENVDTITSGLNIVDSLRPVSFTWKDHPVHNFVAGKTVGFIAQEVQEALSEYDWVDNIIKSNYNEETEEEFLGIAEANIIPLLVAAVKELKVRVETLEAK